MPLSRNLDRTAIVDVAFPILCDEGERSLSMRRVARELGVTPMALYHHVADKDALVDAVLDRLLGTSLEMDDSARPWREAVVAFCVRYRGVLVDHPGAALAYLRRPVVVPATARTTLRLFALLSRGGLDGEDLAAAADAVVLAIMGSVANDVSRPPDVRRGLPHQLPKDEAEALLARIEPYAGRDPEDRFRRTLGWILDGIEVGSSEGKP